MFVGGPRAAATAEVVHGAVGAGRGGVERVESGGLLTRRRRGQEEAVQAAPQHVLHSRTDRCPV